MSLYIDGREEAKHHWSEPLRRLGIDAKVGASLSADFMWRAPIGLILVERKTWPDFVSSVTGSGGADAGNRLVGQLIEAPKGAAVRILFMEGPLPAYVTGKQVVTAEAMDDMSLSLQWQFGCLFVHSMNHDHTPVRLAALYHYTQKEDHRSLLRPVPPVPEEPIYMNAEFRKKIAAMMCVPLMGEKGALILAENTESPRQAINLELEELLKIPGVGKMRGKNFHDFWEKW